MLKLTREFYAPKHYAAKIVSKDGAAIVYLVDNLAHGKPVCVAMGFVGKAARPAFNFSYRSAESRAKYVAEFFASIAASVQRKADDRAARKAFRHTLTVGAILSSSWGYDQTNVDFYEVVKLIGEHMIEVRKLQQVTVEVTGHDTGTCKPVPGAFCGDAKRVRVARGNYITVSGHCASPWDGEPERWSSYA